MAKLKYKALADLAYKFKGQRINVSKGEEVEASGLLEQLATAKKAKSKKNED